MEVSRFVWPNIANICIQIYNLEDNILTYLCFILHHWNRFLIGKGIIITSGRCTQTDIPYSVILNWTLVRDGAKKSHLFLGSLCVLIFRLFMYNSGMMNELDEDLEVLDRVPFDLDAAVRDLQVGPTSNLLSRDAAGANVVR